MLLLLLPQMPMLLLPLLLLSLLLLLLLLLGPQQQPPRRRLGTPFASLFVVVDFWRTKTGTRGWFVRAACIGSCTTFKYSYN
jgi:hypothetical protein